MLLLTLPIIFPTIVALGFDPVWFGVIIVLMMETAATTPPVGINAYVIAGMVKDMDISMSTVFRGNRTFLYRDYGMCRYPRSLSSDCAVST